MNKHLLRTVAAVTIPAYAADTLGETLTLAAPKEWHYRIRALSPECCYGPAFNRSVLTHLRDMSTDVEHGYPTVAYDHLLLAERAVVLDRLLAGRGA